jgi:hypothetical protein
MSERRRQVALTLITALVAVAILGPIFLGLNMLMEAGLWIMTVSVVVLAFLLGYLLRRDTR